MMINASFRQTLHLLTIVLILAGGLALTGCGADQRAAARQLAEAGATTSGALATYYGTLGDQVGEVQLLETYVSSVRDVEFTGTARQALLDLQASLAARRSLALRLGSTYGALNDLAAFDAPGETVASADAFFGELEALTPLPGGPALKPILGGLLEDVVRWRQTRDLKEGAALIQRSLIGVRKLFEAERAHYDRIIALRASKAGSVSSMLIGDDQVDGYAMLEDIVTLPRREDAPLPEDRTRKAYQAVALEKAGQIASLMKAATAEMQTALVLLESRHEEFRQSGSGSIGEVTATLDRLRFYLLEVRKLGRPQA